MDLSNNYLDSIPDSILKLKKLNSLNLVNNLFYQDIKYFDNYYLLDHKKCDVFYEVVSSDLKNKLGFSRDDWQKLLKSIMSFCYKEADLEDETINMVLKKITNSRFYKYNEKLALESINYIFKVILADDTAEQKTSSLNMLSTLGVYLGDCSTPISDFLKEIFMLRSQDNLNDRNYEGLIEKYAVKDAIMMNLAPILSKDDLAEQVEVC